MLIKFNHKGITLIELLAAVLVLVILSMMTVPKLNDMLRNYRVATAAENLYNALQIARLSAIRNNKDVYFYVSQYDDWCYSYGDTAACSCKTPTGENNCLSVSSADKRGILSLYLQNGSISQHWIIFSGTRGTIKNTPTNIKLTFNAYTKVNERAPVAPYIEISINPVGNISMCSVNISGYKSC